MTCAVVGEDVDGLRLEAAADGLASTAGSCNPHAVNVRVAHMPKAAPQILPMASWSVLAYRI